MVKKLQLLVFLNFLLANFVFAQISTVGYDVVSNELNNNNPLPAEESFYLRGIIPSGVESVKVVINRTGRNESRAESYTWRKAFDFEVSEYEVFISDPLRSNDSYDFEIFFYERADSAQMQRVIDNINKNLEAYIRANMEVSSRGIRTNNADGVMINQMNKIVEDGLMDYTHYLGRDFQGFSEIIRQKLDQRSRLRLNMARFNIFRSSAEEDDNEKAAYADLYMNDLIAAVQTEANQYLERSLLALADIRTINNYPTENKPGTLPLNIGYATIPIKRSLGSTEYLHAPYAGLSIPLGNKTFTKFLGNASFSTGVFLQNFEASTGERISGDLIGLPIYAGLGYRMFRVIRLNVGGVMLNMEGMNGSGTATYIQPFAGLSLEFNIWMGFSDRR